MSCEAMSCGVGGWTGPLPGDPSNNLSLSATSVYGGIDIAWTYPTSNPHAVAHTILFRSTSSDFVGAVQKAIIAGNSYYDKSSTSVPTIYYYWIQVVSVNGTYGEPIGPASAVAKPTIEDLLTLLTGQIEAGALAASLKAELTNTTQVSLDLLAEANARVAGNAGLAAAIDTVQRGNATAMTYIQQEIINRKTANDAYVRELNTLAAVTRDNVAAILEEKTVRATQTGVLINDVTLLYGKSSTTEGAIKEESRLRIEEVGAIASKVDTLTLASAGTNATILDINETKLGYSVLVGSTTPFDGDGVTVVYPSYLYPDASYPEYQYNRTKIIDTKGVTGWNSTSASNGRKAQWLRGLPLATAVKAVGVAGPNGEAATLEQAFSAQQTLNNGFKSQYTVKLSIDQGGQKLIGGFGLYNDGATVDAGFDVDRFWVGRSTLVNGAVEKVKPFIIENGKVYMDEAIIRTLKTTSIDTTGYGFFNGASVTDVPSIGTSIGVTVLAKYNTTNGYSPVGGYRVAMAGYNDKPSFNATSVGVVGVALVGTGAPAIGVWGIANGPYGGGTGGKFSGGYRGIDVEGVSYLNGDTEITGNLVVNGTVEGTISRALTAVGASTAKSALTAGYADDSGKLGGLTLSSFVQYVTSSGAAFSSASFNGWIAVTAVGGSTVYLPAFTSPPS